MSVYISIKLGNKKEIWFPMRGCFHEGEKKKNDLLVSLCGHNRSDHLIFLNLFTH